MNHFSMLLGLNENSDLILRWTQAGFLWITVASETTPTLEQVPLINLVLI